MAYAKGELAAILKGVGIKPTSAAIRDFQAWAQAEGGTASFNPFNTTQTAPGATSYNSVGVRNYRNEQQGINATIQTLRNGYYGQILQALRGGNPQQFAQAVGNSKWGTSGSLLSQILGGHVSGNANAPAGHAGGGVPQMRHEPLLGTPQQVQQTPLFHAPVINLPDVVPGQTAAQALASALQGDQQVIPTLPTTSPVPQYQRQLASMHDTLLRATS